MPLAITQSKYGNGNKETLIYTDPGSGSHKYKSNVIMIPTDYNLCSDCVSEIFWV